MGTAGLVWGQRVVALVPCLSPRAFPRAAVTMRLLLVSQAQLVAALLLLPFSVMQSKNHSARVAKGAFHSCEPVNAGFLTNTS